VAKTEITRKAMPKQAKASNDRKPRAERWAELLEAAADIFYEKGYDAASLQEIAARVGILKGSIYYYIETKSDLRDNLLKQVHAEGLEMIHRLAQTEGDAIDKLDAMIHGHIDYATHNLTKVTVYLHELKKLSSKERLKLFGNHGYRDIFLDVLAKGQEEGTVLPALDAKLAAQAMLGALNSVYQWYRPKPGHPSSVVADHFADILLRGHATESALKKRLKRTSAKLASAS
jgi:AcrR family transcriptional regulator